MYSFSRRKQKVFNTIAIFSMCFLAAFIIAAFFAPVRKGDAETKNASDGTSTYSVSISNDDHMQIPITPTSEQEIYSASNTISYTSTCPAGFYVYISSSSESSDLIRAGSDDLSKNIPTISSGTSLGDNTWGYSTNNGSTWNPIPSFSSPSVVLEKSYANATAQTFNVMYGVRTDISLPSGAYSGDVTYTVAAKPQCFAYDITWNFNNGTGNSNAIYPTSLGYGDTIDLTGLSPTRSGYSFLGWAVGSSTFDGTETSANINPSNSIAITITASWKKEPAMQTFYCSSLAVGESIVLTDNRDGNKYTVKKLADGKCWMTENLRLGKSTAMTLTSSDSDVASNFELPAAIATLSSTDFTEHNVKNVYVDSNYGGFYNFYTATAGEGGTTKTSGNTEHSICPRGWRLPTGGSNGDFNTLYSKYGSLALMQNEPAFNFAGYIYGGQVKNRESWGLFWSSTIYDAYNAYNLNLRTGNVINAANYGNKYYGDSVRCVARDTIQNFDTSTLSVGESKKLYDVRDGNYYTVKKLSDGKVWMTENLRLINKTVTRDDTNLPFVLKKYTVPASSTSNFKSDSYTGAYIDSSYGGLYTYFTATAGYRSDELVTHYFHGDICPKGWHLPTGGSSSEYQTLYSKYNSGSLMQGDPNFKLGGYMRNGSASGRGSTGYYWAYNETNTNNASWVSVGSSVSVTGNTYKYTGASIRCVAADKMQDFTGTNLVTNQVSWGLDIRDGEVYPIRKLDNGNIWMLQNLRIQDKKLTPANSNVSSEYTIPASAESGYSFRTEFTEQSPQSVFVDDKERAYGGYYTYFVATAGTGTNELSWGDDAPSSICPKGWRLPKGGDDSYTSDFQKLRDRYGDTALLESGPHLKPFSGDVTIRAGNQAMWDNNGRDTVFWTSTSAYQSNGGTAYRSAISSSYGGFSDLASEKYNGFSVRCLI